MQNYTEVPNIISTKDLAYLSDMFEWNYGAFKNTYNSSTKVNDPELKEILEKGSKLFDENMNQIMQILGGNYE